MSESVWQRWPEAEALIEAGLVGFLAAHSQARRLADAVTAQASTRLFDWLDYLILGTDPVLRARIDEAGFVAEEVEAPAGQTVYHHPGAQLPRLVLQRDELLAGQVTAIAVKADSVADFLLARGIRAPIAGSPYSPYRVATLWPESGRRVLVEERRGYRGLHPQEQGDDYPARYLAARDRWANRLRVTDDDVAGMREALDLARLMAGDMGPDMAAWIVFEVERDYWQRRNWAGQVQKARQDRLGLGWGNHDHHTFRASRQHFAGLIATLEALGFVCRERFYAGEAAGWGAQVLEQPNCGLVVFADVDLSPEERDGDFAHQGLQARQDLGTIGLWCALHGESILGAGMHHLEAQFSFDSLRDDLAGLGVGMMRPFSEMPHLRQAFTTGERWPVAPARLTRLLAAGQITQAQHDRFLAEGALGSHLENLQRREGYKGFNQHNVSTIIRATDPRLLAGATVG